MCKKIVVQDNKSLRLENVLIKNVYMTLGDMMDEANVNIALLAEQMDNQLKSKGANSVGPLIQFVKSGDGAEDDIDVKLSLMLQSNKYINNIDDGFQMKSVVSVKDCMYTRFCGREEDLNFAYQKLQVEAYEKDIKLNGASYTIFVGCDENDISTIDVFMEKEDVK